MLKNCKVTFVTSCHSLFRVFTYCPTTLVPNFLKVSSERPCRTRVPSSSTTNGSANGSTPCETLGSSCCSPSCAETATVATSASPILPNWS